MDIVSQLSRVGQCRWTFGEVLRWALLSGAVVSGTNELVEQVSLCSRVAPQMLSCVGSRLGLLASSGAKKRSDESPETPGVSRVDLERITQAHSAECRPLVSSSSGPCFHVCVALRKADCLQESDRGRENNVR